MGILQVPRDDVIRQIFFLNQTDLHLSHDPPLHHHSLAVSAFLASELSLSDLQSTLPSNLPPLPMPREPTVLVPSLTWQTLGKLSDLYFFKLHT